MMGKEKTHGKFWKVVKEAKGSDRTWQWMRGGHLRKWQEGYICAAQERVIRTRQYEAVVLKQGGDRKCRLCHNFNENVEHLISGCEKLSQGEYSRRHDKVGLRIYWELLGKYGLKRKVKWYEENVVSGEVRKSDDGKIEIWWDKWVTVTKELEHYKPDVVVFDYRERKGLVVEFSVPYDGNVHQRVRHKRGRYIPLSDEIGRMYGLNMKVVPVVVGALGTVTKDLETAIEDMGIPDVIGGLQTTAVIATAAILRKVLA